MIFLKTKTFRSMFTHALDNKINEFILQNNIEIIDIKYSVSMFDVSAMIIYKG